MAELRAAEAAEMVIDEPTGTALAAVKPQQVAPALNIGGVLMSMGDAFRMADALCQATTMPKWIKGAGDVMACMLEAHTLELPLMSVIKGSHFIEGKLTLSPELMLAAVRAQGLLAYYSRDEYTDEACQITLQRKGDANPVTERFTMADAKKSGLDGKDVWRKYPKRMLYHRVLGYILRDAFPDVLAGTYGAEEMGAEVAIDGTVPDIDAEIAELEAIWEAVHAKQDFHQAKAAYNAARRATVQADKDGKIGNRVGHFKELRDRAKAHLLKLQGDSMDHEAGGQQPVAEAEEADEDEPIDTEFEDDDAAPGDLEG